MNEKTRLCDSYAKGDRVATCAHTDAFMQGDRYGTVAHVGRKFVHVLMDRSNRVRKFHPTSIERI